MEKTVLPKVAKEEGILMFVSELGIFVCCAYLNRTLVRFTAEKITLDK